MPIPQKVSLIVIGGGITGLSAAITWARNNPADRRVLVIEKQPVVGGYVTSFRRQGYLFDTVQLIPDSTEVLDYLGVNIELKQFAGYYARLFLADTTTQTAKIINIPAGVEEFQTFLQQRYPADAVAIRRFFAYATAMFDELYYLKVEPTLPEILRILGRCPKIIANSNKTFQQLIDKFRFTEPEIFEILNMFAAFSGLPAERVSALLPVSAMLASLKGSWRPLHGFIEFPQKMRQRLEELGGQVLTKTTVTKILIENNRATGVQLDSGEKIYADYMVTTIDPKVAMQKLVGEETLRRASRAYADKVERVKMSASALMINLGLDDRIDLKTLGFNCGYNLLTTGRGIYNKMYTAFERGKLFLSRDEFYVPVICPSLPVGKKNALTIFAYPAPIADWPALRESDYGRYTTRKQQVADLYLDLVQTYMIPNLRAHIVYTDIATPATFARYSGSPTGSKFDMAPYPDNFGKNRLKMRTPIQNLFQPKFSHGIWPCLLAGLQVVDMMMERKIMGGNARYGK